MNESSDNERFIPVQDILKERAREFQREKQRIRRQLAEEYLNQPFDYRDYIISPEGYEGPALVFYIATIPYVSGLLFIYLFIARTQMDIFIGLDLASYFVIWAIGYEACAAAVLTAIFIGWLKYLSNRTNKEPEHKKPLY